MYLTGFIILITLLWSCTHTNRSEEKKDQILAQHTADTDILINTMTEDSIIQDQEFTLKYNHTEVPVRIIGGSSEKVLLLLHGWNLPASDWCEKTDFCMQAREANYTIILPDFGKSTYQWETYPETIDKYLPWPTRQWMYEYFFSYLQDSVGVLMKDGFNAVVGLSTGGRGAALMALEKPGIFDVCVALSADFDQSKLIGEPINTGFYGAYEKFKVRWKGRDNIYLRAKEWQVPVYLGHGSLDKMCPIEQSVDFNEKLDSLKFTEKHLSTPKAGHTYTYWNSECSPVMDFIEKYYRKNKI